MFYLRNIAEFCGIDIITPFFIVRKDLEPRLVSNINAKNLEIEL